MVNFIERATRFTESCNRDDNAEASRKIHTDEIGCLPIDKDSAHGFFQLVAVRYEKKAYYPDDKSAVI